MLIRETVIRRTKQMAYLDTDNPMWQRAMKIEEINEGIHNTRGNWQRAKAAGDQDAMDFFESDGKNRIAHLQKCLTAFKEVFGKNYRLRNPAIKAAA